MTTPTGREQSPAAPTGFIRALGLFDVVVLNVVAVVSLRWIARGARMGAPSVMLWVLACVAFSAFVASQRRGSPKPRLQRINAR